MRDDLEQVLRDRTLVSIAFAIAAGWSLFQLAHGVAIFVDGLTTHSQYGPYGAVETFGLTWSVGHRFIALDAFVEGLVELVVVLGAAVLLRRRFPDTAST